MAGLSSAMLLAADGHQVTVLERDPAGPPPPERAEEACDGWQRSGVNQFRLPHFMLPRWWAQLGAELPTVGDALTAAGANRFNYLELLPEGQRGPMRAGDEIFDTVTARRPVLEVAMSAAAEAAGVRVERGVGVTGLTTDGGIPVPRVTGVRTAGGRTYSADLVVDCGGRRSALPAWLEAAGARRPAEERAEGGLIYYARQFRSRSGALPQVATYLLQHYDSLSVITLPGDHDTWSVVLTASTRDKALRVLREPDRWHAVLSRYPLAAHWADGEPITGVDVRAGIEDRYRRLAVDGRPVATGVALVGDACACTSPSLGRGAAMALLHARLLRDVLRETDPQDHNKLAQRFDEVTTEVLEPQYRVALWFDSHRLAEIDADMAGVPYRTDDERWLMSKALFAAGLIDQELARAYTAVTAFLTSPDEVLAQPGVAGRVAALGRDAPQYPQPGPSRAELLAI